AGSFPFLANGRARALGDTTGFAKVIADAKTDEVLGVHIVGPMASELISEAVTIMEFRGAAEDIARICHAHPTLSEAVKEAALAVDKRALSVGCGGGRQVSGSRRGPAAEVGRIFAGTPEGGLASVSDPFGVRHLTAQR